MYKGKRWWAGAGAGTELLGDGGSIPGERLLADGERERQREEGGRHKGEHDGTRHHQITECWYQYKRRSLNLDRPGDNPEANVWFL